MLSWKGSCKSKTHVNMSLFLEKLCFSHLCCIPLLTFLIYRDATHAAGMSTDSKRFTSRNFSGASFIGGLEEYSKILRSLFSLPLKITRFISSLNLTIPIFLCWRTRDCLPISNMILPIQIVPLVLRLLLFVGFSQAQSNYWVANIKRQGSVAFSPNSTTYPVFRNVRDYGAKGNCFPPLSEPLDWLLIQVMESRTILLRSTWPSVLLATVVAEAIHQPDHIANPRLSPPRWYTFHLASTWLLAVLWCITSANLLGTRWIRPLYLQILHLAPAWALLSLMQTYIYLVEAAMNGMPIKITSIDKFAISS